MVWPSNHCWSVEIWCRIQMNTNHGDQFMSIQTNTILICTYTRRSNPNSIPPFGQYWSVSRLYKPIPTNLVPNTHKYVQIHANTDPIQIQTEMNPIVFYSWINMYLACIRHVFVCIRNVLVCIRMYHPRRTLRISSPSVFRIGWYQYVSACIVFVIACILHILKNQYWRIVTIFFWVQYSAV